MNKDQAAELIKKLTSSSKHYSVVNIVGREEAVTRFAKSSISQNVNLSDISVSLTMYDDKKEVTCTTNALDDSGLKQLVDDTERLLYAAPEGEFTPFPLEIEEDNFSSNASTCISSFDAKCRAEAIKEGVEKLPEGFISAGALMLEKKLAAYGNSENSNIRFSTLDNVQFNTVTTHSISGADGGGECISHQIDEIRQNIPDTFAQAHERAARGANPVTLNAGQYTVILSPVAMGDLMTFVIYSLCAKRVEDGVSFYTPDIQEAVFGSNITVKDDVNDPRIFPWPFDYEGHKRQSLSLIEKGAVKNILHDNKTAQRMNMSLTGHAISNKGLGGLSFHTVMDGGDKSLEEIIQDTSQGIFISELHYTNFVNPRALQITGLTRNGTFLIENGKLSNAVKTLRFTQNLIEALNSVTALSLEQTKVISSWGSFAGGWAALMPAVRIEKFNFQ